LLLRTGPGALILPKEVSKISLEFNTKLYGGHRGARYVALPYIYIHIVPSLHPGYAIERKRHADIGRTTEMLMLTCYRKFWREMLPRMKYRNPSIPMTISRHHDPDGPSLLHIYTRQPTPIQTPTPDTTTAPPSATPNPQTTLVPDTSPPTHTLNIRDMEQSEILDALIKTIDVEVIRPTEQEEAEMRDFAEQNERSEQDRVLVREKLTKERREQELLKLARGEVSAEA
jgi:large subunit ribosomal protein MRP49